MELIDNTERAVRDHSGGAIVSPGLDQGIAGRDDRALCVGGFDAPGDPRPEAVLGLRQLALSQPHPIAGNSYLLLGRGKVPVPKILSMLSRAGYDGWLSVEWEKRWQPDIPDADVALPRYADGIRALLADLR